MSLQATPGCSSASSSTPGCSSASPSAPVLSSKPPSPPAEIPQTDTQLLTASIRRKFRASDKRPYPCTYSGCKKRYSSAVYLEKHKCHHPRPFICRYTPCITALVSPEDRNSHELNAHGKDENADLVCYLCGFTRPGKRNISDHLRHCHSDFDRKDTLAIIVDNRGLGYRGVAVQAQQRVARTFSEDLPILVCYICGFSSRDGGKVRKHLAYHHKSVTVKDAMARIRGGVSVRDAGSESHDTSPLLRSICAASTMDVAEGPNYAPDHSEDVAMKDVPVRATTTANSVVMETKDEDVDCKNILVCHNCNYSTEESIDMRNHVCLNREGVGLGETMGRALNGLEIDEKVRIGLDGFRKSLDVCELCGFSTKSRTKICGYGLENQDGLKAEDSTEINEIGTTINSEDIATEKKAHVANTSPSFPEPDLIAVLKKDMCVHILRHYEHINQGGNTNTAMRHPSLEQEALDASLPVCYICGFSTAKSHNMYRHVLRNHRHIDIQKAMKIIIAAIVPNE